jgi:hypothetical protein
VKINSIPAKGSLKDFPNSGKAAAVVSFSGFFSSTLDGTTSSPSNFLTATCTKSISSFSDRQNSEIIFSDLAFWVSKRLSDIEYLFPIFPTLPEINFAMSI